MNDMIKNLSSMLNNKEIPDNIKNIINNISSNENKNTSNDNSFKNNESNNFNSNFNFSNNNDDNENRNNSNNSFPEFDINTILKMKKIMDAMKTNKNDPRANLLISLKPYLKDSRKEKVDQYVKLFNMSKAFEIINPLGGDDKNDT